MQRKASKKTPGPNARQKKLMAWTAQQPCIQCGAWPVIVEHCYGSTFRHNKILIGMDALLPLCPHCDSVKTNGSHRSYLEAFGEPQSQSVKRHMANCPEDIKPPQETLEAIYDWNR